MSSTDIEAPVNRIAERGLFAATIGVRTAIAVADQTFGGERVAGRERFGMSSAKRALDLLGATVGLLAFAPLMIVLAIVIKLDSPGPVFFRQQRVHRDGELFHLLKFRTMVVEAEHLKPTLAALNEACEGLFKIAEDPRITPIGKLLRRTHLDELPQLFSVLRGTMSLVGPRPLIPEEDMLIQGWDRRRQELTPGMTGPWQLLGPRRVSLREMVALDCSYGATWSLWTDVKILLRTAQHVFMRRGL